MKATTQHTDEAQIEEGDCYKETENGVDLRFKVIKTPNNRFKGIEGHYKIIWQGETHLKTEEELMELINTFGYKKIN